MWQENTLVRDWYDHAARIFNKDIMPSSAEAAEVPLLKLSPEVYQKVLGYLDPVRFLVKPLKRSSSLFSLFFVFDALNASTVSL